MDKKIKIEQGSDNVFADLNVPNPEKELAKSTLAWRIFQIIKKKKLTQAQAAKLLSITQPKVSALINGELRSFSFERLLKFLTILGQDITVTIAPSEKRRGRGLVRVENDSVSEQASVRK